MNVRLIFIMQFYYKLQFDSIFSFRKNCFIEYSQTAQEVTVEVCRETLVKDCDATGPEVCSTEYESECETVQHPHDVEDDVVECRTEIQSKCEDVTSGYTSSQQCSDWPVERQEHCVFIHVFKNLIFFMDKEYKERVSKKVLLKLISNIHPCVVHMHQYMDLINELISL